MSLKNFADHQLNTTEFQKELGVVLKKVLEYDYQINANGVLGLIRHFHS